MSKLFKNIGIVLDLEEAASPCRVFALTNRCPRSTEASLGAFVGEAPWEQSTGSAASAQALATARTPLLPKCTGRS